MPSIARFNKAHIVTRLKHTEEAHDPVLAIVKKEYPSCFPSLVIFSLSLPPLLSLLISSMLTYKYPAGSTRVMYRQTRIEYALRSVYSRSARERRFKNGWRAPSDPPHFLFHALLSILHPFFSRRSRRRFRPSETSHLYSTISEAPLLPPLSQRVFY